MGSEKLQGTPGEKISQPTELYLACRAGIHPTLPASPALFMAASLGQVEMLSFTHSVSTIGVVGLWQLTSCSAKAEKVTAAARPGPALPRKGEGGDSPG